MGELYRLNFQNGKSYIGITTKTAKSRFQGHKKAAKEGKTPLYFAWRKHGAPELVVLAVLENRELAETEIRAIAAYGTEVPKGYNVLPGGQTSPMTNPEIAKKLRGNKHSLGMKFPRELYPAKDAHYKRIKGKKLPESRIAALVVAQNKPEAKELRRKMLLERNPMKEPVFAEKQAAKMRGRKLTKEHAEKARSVITEAWKDPEFRANQIAKRVGKKLSEETLQKMRISQRARRERGRS